MRLPSSKRRLELARGIVCACIAALPVCLGGAHVLVNVFLAVAMGLALALTLWSGEKLTLGPVALVLLLAVGSTALQLVPLPVSWMERLAPGAYAVLSMQGIALHPLSLDLGGTAHELTKLVALAMAALMARALFKSPLRIKLASSLAVGGLLVMAVGFVQAMCAVSRPYGFFGDGPPGWFVSTFVNPNHLAGFLGLCTFVCLGRALHRNGRIRWLMVMACSLSGLGVLLSLSRGGIIALIGGLLFVSLFHRTVERRGARILAMCLGVAVVGALLAAYGPLVQEFSQYGGFSKLDLVWEVPRLLREFPVLGMGRGTFGTVFTRYLPPTFPHLAVSHIENEWSQTLIDFGPVLGLTFIIIIGRAVHDLRRRGAELGIVAGLLFLGVHNIVDFNLELTAIALPAVLLLAAHGPSRPPAIAPRSALAIGAALALLLVIVAPTALLHSLGTDMQNLEAALTDRTMTAPQRGKLATETLYNHPADYFVPQRLGEYFLRAHHNPERAATWARRAAFLAPSYFEPRFILGWSLLSSGQHEDALIELREVCRAAPEQARQVASLVWAYGHNPAWVTALGHEAPPSVRLAISSFLLAQKQPSAASLALGNQLPHENPWAAQLAGDIAMSTGSFGEAEDVARAAQHRWPELPAPYSQEGHALLARGDSEGALAVLERGMKRTGTSLTLLNFAALILCDRGQSDVARDLVQQSLGASANGSVPALMIQGYIEGRAGRSLEALRFYERARAQAPGDLEIRVRIARLLEQLGDYVGAIKELEESEVESTSFDVSGLISNLRQKQEAQTSALRLQQALDESAALGGAHP